MTGLLSALLDASWNRNVPESHHVRVDDASGTCAAVTGFGAEVIGQNLRPTGIR